MSYSRWLLWVYCSTSKQWVMWSLCVAVCAKSFFLRCAFVWVCGIPQIYKVWHPRQLQVACDAGKTVSTPWALEVFFILWSTLHDHVSGRVNGMVDIHYKDLTFQSAERLSHTTMLVSTPGALDNFFENTLFTNDLLQEPSIIFKIDETSIPLNPFSFGASSSFKWS